jgi:predicted Zn-dependent protease with MMP-like domain
VRDGDYRLSPQEFEAAVDEALSTIPAELRAQLRNIAILVEPECPPGEEELLGVYDGIPLTERDESWVGALPDRITLFQGPLERMCETREDLLEEIAVTVVHEIGHYFGIDDERLHDLGWG